MARPSKQLQELDAEIEKKKNTKFTFSFNDFELNSLESGKIRDFNNNYEGIKHFLRVNGCLFDALKLLSNETYKTTIIEHKLERIMHFKLLDRPESVQKINNILINGYDKSENTIKQWEDSKYVEFGYTDEERFIGIIIDYNIISILYVDPNHLTFPNKNFDIDRKLNYTTPGLFSKKSTSTIDLNKDMENSAEIIKDKDYKKEEYEMAILENINGKMTDTEMAEFCREVYKGGER